MKRFFEHTDALMMDIYFTFQTSETLSVLHRYLGRVRGAHCHELNPFLQSI
jgi:uncharacterized protein YigA (DUF484 family)